MCDLIFSNNLSDTFIILRRIQRDIIIYVRRSSRKITFILSDFNETCLFSIELKKKLKHKI